MSLILWNGEPGSTHVNRTGRVVYQLIVNWHNSCGLCAQYDHAIGYSWPIPFHYNCRCHQIAIYPTEESRPFVDFREKINELDHAEQSRVIGRSNLTLIESGVAKWTDVVTPGRVRGLHEVVSLLNLDVTQLTAAGVSPRIAKEAYSKVNTAAHVIAEEQRRKAVESLVAKGIERKEVRRAVAERLAGRVSIGAGPSGPSPSPVSVTPPPSPPPAPRVVKAPPEAIEKALGVKLKPPPGASPPSPTTQGKLADWKEGDRLVAKLADIGDIVEIRKARAVRLAKELDDAAAAYAKAPTEETRKALADLTVSHEDAVSAYERWSKNARGLAADAIAVSDPVRLNFVEDKGQGKPLADDARNAAGEVLTWLSRITSKGIGSAETDVTFRKAAARGDGRSFFDFEKINLASADRSTIAHELGHYLEAAFPGVGKAARDYLESRVGAEPLTPIADVLPGHGFAPNELGRRDRFEELFGDSAWYVGKHYEDGSTEITAMALQELWRDAGSLAKKDPGLTKFLLSVLRGVFK